MDDDQLGSSREKDRSTAHSVMAALGEPPAEHREVILKGMSRASSSQSILVLTPQDRLYHRVLAG